MERLYSAKEISALTGMSRSAVNTLMRSGEIESIPTGIRTDGPRPRLRAYESAVDRWIARRQAESQQPKREPYRPARRTKPGELPEGMEYGPNGKPRIKRRR